MSYLNQAAILMIAVAIARAAIRGEEAFCASGYCMQMKAATGMVGGVSVNWECSNMKDRSVVREVESWVPANGDSAKTNLQDRGYHSTKCDNGRIILRPTANQLELNETNETEFDVYLLPTPPPTKPVTNVVVSAEIASASDISVDQAFLTDARQGMLDSLGAGSGVSLDEITAVVEYTVEQSFDFTIVVEEPVAKAACASTFDVSEDEVSVTITSTRRLHAQSGRRLAGSKVDAVITVASPAKADQVKSTGAGTDVTTQLANNYKASHELAYEGSTIAAPTITAEPPKLTLDIRYEIQSGTTTPVAPPSVDTLKTNMESSDTLKDLAASITIETEAPTVAPTMLPPGQTFAPTAPTVAPTAPTAVPTKMPTAMPTAMDTAMPTAITIETEAPTVENTTTTLGAAAESGAPSSYCLSGMVFASVIAFALAQ